MKEKNESGKYLTKRNGEKGAAMIIVLLVALLLLVASAGVLLQASMSSANVTDITSEQQAYNSAESGIQTALNVLRGNVVPQPLLDDTKPVSHPSNKITFSKAVKLAASNSPGDVSTVPRLSRWLNYNHTPAGTTNPDRVTIGKGTYDPLTGNAFDIEIIDPDNPGKLISLELTANIGGSGSSKTFFGPLGAATIKYNSATKANVDVSIREAGIDLGSFTISTIGYGAYIPVDTRFEIKVKMTAPFKATAIVRGTITRGQIS